MTNIRCCAELVVKKVATMRSKASFLMYLTVLLSVAVASDIAKVTELRAHSRPPADASHCIMWHAAICDRTVIGMPYARQACWQTVENVCPSPIDLYWCRGTNCGGGGGTYFKSALVLNAFGAIRNQFMNNSATLNRLLPQRQFEVHWAACFNEGGPARSINQVAFGLTACNNHSAPIR